MEREEILTVDGITFIASNRIAVPVSKENPLGVRYMTDAEFEVHKLDQILGLRETRSRQAAQEQRKLNRQNVMAKLAQAVNLTQNEIEELFNKF